jgi:hypothetical protein
MPLTLLLLTIAILLGGSWLAVQWLFVEIGTLKGIDRALAATYYRHLTWFLLGALAVYILLVFSFGTYYWWIHSSYHFKCDPSCADWIDFIYFSLVTMATVGYGDIVPRSWEMRVVVVAEMLVGMAFLVLMLGIFFSISPIYATESSARVQRLIDRLHSFRIGHSGRSEPRS